MVLPMLIDVSTPCRGIIRAEDQVCVGCAGELLVSTPCREIIRAEGLAIAMVAAFGFYPLSGNHPC